MKLLILLTALLLIGCAGRPPEVRVWCDTTKIPWGQYERDHDDCLTKARAAWPVTETELRAPMSGAAYEAYNRLNSQRAYVIDCLEKKGYRVIPIGEPVPF